MNMKRSDIVDFMQDERRGYRWFMKLRNSFRSELIREVPSAFDPVEVIIFLLNKCKELGLDFRVITPGHGIGHIARDYVHAVALLGHMLPASGSRDISASLGFVSGVFHDIATIFRDRFEDHQNLLRHGEIGAYLIYQLLEDAPHVNDAARKIIAYSIAAHTHHLRPHRYAVGNDVYIIDPYQDVFDGKPFLPLWYTRWIDRLDANGVMLPARLFLTLAETRTEDNGITFAHDKLDESMRLLLRGKALQKCSNGNPNQTFLEYLYMYVTTQMHPSVYNVHDSEEMKIVAQKYGTMLYELISLVMQHTDSISLNQQYRIFKQWSHFLVQTVEPARNTIHVVSILEECFFSIENSQLRSAWCAFFRRAIDLYKRSVMSMLKEGFDQHQHFPTDLPLIGNVLNIIDANVKAQ